MNHIWRFLLSVAFLMNVLFSRADGASGPANKKISLNLHIHRKMVRVSINRQGPESEVCIVCSFRKFMTRLGNRPAAYAAYSYDLRVAIRLEAVTPSR